MYPDLTQMGAEKLCFFKREKGESMKCPKCGYNTFEYLDSCKKCGKELASFKESMGIRPLVLHAAVPAVAAIAAAGELLQGSGAISDSADDKLFQWDTPETDAESGMSGINEFEMIPGVGIEKSAEPPKDPFSFDEEFDIPASPQQAGAEPEAEDPFGGFSLDDLGSSPEEPLPDMTLKQDKAQEEQAFEGFAFEDEESTGDAREELPVAAVAGVDDIFGGFTLEEGGVAAEEKVETDLLPGEEPAGDSVFGEFSLDEQPSDIAEKPAEPLQSASADNIFGEFAFEEPAGVSLSDAASGEGFADIFDEKQASEPEGAEFSLDAFAVDFSGAAEDSSPVDAAAGDEFDLDDFLKIEDEPKAFGSQVGGVTKSSVEDLDALFGELDLTEKK